MWRLSWSSVSCTQGRFSIHFRSKPFWFGLGAGAGMPTISSSHMGHTSLALEAPASEGPPILILEARSWGPKSAMGVDDEGGEMEFWEVE